MRVLSQSGLRVELGVEVQPERAELDVGQTILGIVDAGESMHDDRVVSKSRWNERTSKWGPPYR